MPKLDSNKRKAAASEDSTKTEPTRNNKSSKTIMVSLDDEFYFQKYNIKPCQVQVGKKL
jgi:hypothetical protein